MDVLLQVVRAFGSAASQGSDPTPLDDLDGLSLELILADLGCRREAAGPAPEGGEAQQGHACRAPPARAGAGAVHPPETTLAAERPLRELELTAAEERALRGYGLLTAKPLLVLFNVDEPGPAADALVEQVRGRSGGTPRPSAWPASSRWSLPSCPPRTPPSSWRCYGSPSPGWRG